MSLGVTIKSLDVSFQPIRVGDNTTVRQRVASAVVLDERSGREVTLTHRERFFTGAVSAFVAAPGETATREVREGDTFKVGETAYKIESVKTTPPAIEVTKESPTLSQPDRRTLLPRDPDPAEGGDPEPPPAASR